VRPAAISWSGGKDSCLALLRARGAGIDVRTFVTMCEPDGTSKSHALSPELVEAQVTRFGRTWHPVRVNSGEYRHAFSRMLADLVASGHVQMVFGDIDLKAHRDWLEPLCAQAGIEAVFPLWGERRQALAHEIIDRQIRACVVALDTSRLDASFCGADYDYEFLRRLPADVCPCGEDGEFHTFVFEAPGMTTPVRLKRGACRLRPSTPPLRPTLLAFQELSAASD